jgi:DNA-binding response OmpR family regulator
MEISAPYTRKQNVNAGLSSTPPRILVVDDEPSLRSLLRRVLGREGFEVLLATNGREGLDSAAKEKPDLVVLDLSLPDVDGDEVCRQMRRTPAIENIPVLILTGKTAEGLLARCLNGGADDYLTKPFDIEEILARLRALLRRSRGLLSSQQGISKGRLTIRVAERMVLWNGQRIPALAPKEFELLRHLVFHAPSVLDKNTLALKAWGVPFDQLHRRTLDVHIRRIRRKLGPTAASCLKTIPAVGFQWLDEAASPASELLSSGSQ